MALVLYDNPASSNAMKVRFLLAELGLEYERRHVGLGRPRPGWYAELYPFATIPFLEDGEIALGESNAILRYLANREGRTDLYPPAPAERARVDWALDAWSTQFRGGFWGAERVALGHGDLEQGGGSAEEADPDELAAALEELYPRLDVMERFVAGNGSVLGTFTVADCAFAPVLWRSYRLPLAIERWPRVALLRDTVTSRPGFQSIGLVA
jgi:glutathione S-transferase